MEIRTPCPPPSAHIPSPFSLFLRVSYNLCKNIKATAQRSHLLLQKTAIMVLRAGYDFSSTDICCCEKNIMPNIKGQGFFTLTKHWTIKKLKFLKERASEEGMQTVWTRKGTGQTGIGSRANSKLSYFSSSCHHMPGAVLRTGKSIMSQRDGLSVPHSCMLGERWRGKWWARKLLSAVAR